jgi:hypothetical protein
MSKTLKTGHSSYWLNEDLWFNVDEGEDTEVSKPANDITKIMKLATVRRAISNFVSILSGENLPVYFQGEDSYTDGKRVVIAADDNPANFDVAVGLALHEASHVLLSDFIWLKAVGQLVDQIGYRDTFTVYYGKGIDIRPLTPALGGLVETFFRPEIVDAMSATTDKYMVELSEQGKNVRDSFSNYVYSTVVSEYVNHIKSIMNVLEDRRIDRHIYRNATGYRPYYNALYDKYFYTTEAGKMLKFDPEARIPTVNNYINHIIYHIHPDSDPDALPGLRAIFEEMDLSNVHLLGPEYDATIAHDAFTYEMTPKLWQKANDIMVMIIKFTDLYVEFQEGAGDQIGQVGDNADGSDGSEEGDLNTDEPSSPSDMAPRAPQVGKKKSDTAPKSDKVNRELDKVKELMDGKTKKKKISKGLAASVRAMEQAQGEMIDVSVAGMSRIKCMVTRNVTEQLLKEDWFLFSHGIDDRWADRRMMDSILAGRRMGQILHQRLQIRNDPMTTRQTRLSSGKIERRLLANLGMDNTDVFYRTRTDSHRPAMLHLTIDASGSMSGNNFRQTMTVATAMAYLTSKMDNVDCVISLRGGDKFPIVAVVFDSRRDSFQKWMKFAPHFHACGNTPEGLCFAATMDIILENSNTHDVYFINFSDGMPGFYINDNATILTGPSRGGEWYQNQMALDHTRKMVRHLKENGVKVLSYFIGDEYGYGRNEIAKNFSYMYGDTATFVDVTSVTNVLNTMNKLLMKR